MQKISMVSRNDWVRLGARLEASHDTVLDLYTMLANSLGKSHPVTKKTLTAYNKIARLKSDMRRLARENARGVFEEMELDSLFPFVKGLREWD